MATVAPALPPDIQRQQDSPEEAQSVFAQQGLDQNNNPQSKEVLQQVMQHIQKLDEWAGQAKQMLEGYDPSLVVLLQPIAKAGMDIAKALQQKAQRSGMQRGSPVVPPNAPQNPAAGPPQPTGV